MIDLTLEQTLGRTVHHYQLCLPIKKKKIISQSKRVIVRKLDNIYVQK